LVQQVCFVNEQHGQRFFSTELLDVLTDGQEHVASSHTVGDAQAVAEVSIEVAATERDIVAVGQTESLVGAQSVPQGTQDTGFAHPGLTGDDSVLPFLDAGDELLDDVAFALGQPELVVVDFLGEGLRLEPEMVEIGAHDSSFAPRVGFLPSVLSSRALGGSKGTGFRAGCAESRQELERGLCALALGLTGCSTCTRPSCSIQGGSIGSTMQRETVTSLPARKCRSVSQSLPSMGNVLSRRTRRRA